MVNILLVALLVAALGFLAYYHHSHIDRSGLPENFSLRVKISMLAGFAGAYALLHLGKFSVPELISSARDDDTTYVADAFNYSIYIGGITLFSVFTIAALLKWVLRVRSVGYDTLLLPLGRLFAQVWVSAAAVLAIVYTLINSQDEDSALQFANARHGVFFVTFILAYILLKKRLRTGLSISAAE